MAQSNGLTRLSVAQMNMVILIHYTGEGAGPHPPNWGVFTEKTALWCIFHKRRLVMLFSEG